MKIRLQLAIAAAAAALVMTSGCGTTSDYVDANDTTAAVKDKKHISSADFIVAVNKLSNELLTSPQLKEFLDDYAKDADAKLKKEEAAGATISARDRRNALKPLLMISDVENRTDDHIETPLVTDRLREVMFKSGKFRFTTYAGGDGQHIDKATAGARDMGYNDPNIKKSTRLKKGQVNAYNLSLAGVIIKQRAKSGRKNEMTFFFSLTLTDNERGEGVWSQTFELKRQHVESAFGY